MAAWSPVRSIAVGGLVAVGFPDEERVGVGSHSGLGVFDAASGAILARVPDVDGSYDWHRDEPPALVYADDRGQHVVPVAGLWGGELATRTADGWSAELTPTGARLAGPEGIVVEIDDHDEPRALGFSPGGRIFVHATTATLHLAVRPGRPG
ncbi:hypothetical protein [Pimelobacter sp. 30-1]|uniref:hypothetical protein n=1 Tax=Pimelobacter sp. 30-1 TaxID=2004991 RepID=UPI001C04203C|nr:hypothetical protein [Pimelobacter sp. 30-1]MBU2694156.1 hypothetical protein [Pimelobacter sp. 30-1]